jgi:hypothetical protein
MRHIAIAGILLSVAGTAAAQNTNVVSSKQAGDQGGTGTQIAIPGGATASITNATPGAGPVLGFQVWNDDTNSFIGAFFTLSAPQSISGTQKDFGTFVLNPPGQGTSFYISGSQAWPVKKATGLLLGFAGRAGITQANWQATVGGSSQTVSAFVAYFNPNFLVSTKAFKSSAYDENGTAQSQNEYQVGFEIGPDWHVIGGDVGQNSAFRSDPSVLGTTGTRFTGLSTTLYVRLNAFEPYVRISYFGKPNGNVVTGLTGWQAVFSVNVLSAIFQTQAQ